MLSHTHTETDFNTAWTSSPKIINIIIINSPNQQKITNKSSSKVRQPAINMNKNSKTKPSDK